MSLSQLLSSSSSEFTESQNVVREHNGGRELEPEWIVGKIYADWCGHCVNMAKAWEELKTKMQKEKGGKVKIIDIEEKQMADKIPKLNQTYFHGKELIKGSGFPTLFMFHTKHPHKTLNYYKGNRDLLAMKQWIEQTMTKMHKGGSRKMYKGSGKKNRGKGRKTRRQNRKQTEKMRK